LDKNNEKYLPKIDDIFKVVSGEYFDPQLLA
jgi:hypothetical protein